MLVVLWTFRARPGHEAEFEQAYGDNGAWSRLFRTSAGYLGTELLRGTDGTYLTIDRWVTEEAYRAFKEREATAYAELDAQCAALTIEEALLGAIEA